MFVCVGPRRRATVSHSNGGDRECFVSSGRSRLDLDLFHGGSPVGGGRHTPVTSTSNTKPRVLVRKWSSAVGQRLVAIPEQAAIGMPPSLPRMPGDYWDALRPPPPVAWPPALGHRRMQSAPHATVGAVFRQELHQGPVVSAAASTVARPKRASTISTSGHGLLAYGCEDPQSVKTRSQRGSAVWSSTQVSTTLWQHPARALKPSALSVGAIKYTQESAIPAGPEQCEWRASWDVI
ncbi:hypothetical protein GGH95_000148 [Coemansia sp. RSA 1836]|nr:hypothetical protein GGH95_000148 [Coemansia sp. RSA 1836]